MPPWLTYWTASASCSISCHPRSGTISLSSFASSCRRSSPTPRSADDLGDRKPLPLEGLAFLHDGPQRVVELQHHGVVGRLGRHLDVNLVLLGGELGQLTVDPVQVLLRLTQLGGRLPGIPSAGPGTRASRSPVPRCSSHPGAGRRP